MVLESQGSEREVKEKLEAALERHAGNPIRVLVRTSRAIAAVLADNPFGKEAPNRTVVIFLDDRTTASTLDDISGRDEEKIALGRREIYIAYGHRMGQSRLKIPGAVNGTARNINTVASLSEMALRR